MAAPEKFRRRRLPHWDVDGAIYFVTTCLQGSIPSQGLLDIDGFRARWQHRPTPHGMTRRDWQIRSWKAAFARADDWLDRQPAVRHLADPRLAGKVVDAIRHFRGVRYELYAYVVMPSHLHWVFRPLPNWTDGTPSDEWSRSPRETIMHSLKRWTAREGNQLLGKRGPFWQRESYDHCVSDLDELERIVQYVETNPVRAGLASTPEEWPFSSAAEHCVAHRPDI